MPDVTTSTHRPTTRRRAWGPVRVSIGLLLATGGVVAWNYGCDRITADVTDMQRQVVARQLVPWDLHVARFDQGNNGRGWVWRARMADRGGRVVTSVNQTPAQLQVGTHLAAYRIDRGRYYFPRLDTPVAAWFRWVGSAVATAIATLFVMPGRRRGLRRV